MAITLRGDADSDFSNGIDISGTDIVLNDDGTANFTGNVEIGGGDIELNADGSATFDGNVTVGDITGNHIFAAATAGQLNIRRDGVANQNCLRIFSGGGAETDAVVSIRNDGSAVFNGRIVVGTNDVTDQHEITANVDSTNGALLVHNRNTVDDSPAAQFRVGSANSGTANALVKFSIGQGTGGSGQINANGVQSCTFGQWSDSRLKQNITELPSQWDNIKALKPSQFEFTSHVDAGTQVGFIAQEFQKVYPEAVATQAMPVPVAERSNPEVEETVDRLMLTGWSKTEAYLVKALQECMTRIETLESRLSTLEGGNT